MEILSVLTELNGLLVKVIFLYPGSNHTITYVSITIGILAVLALLAGLLIKYCLFSKKSITSPPGWYIYDVSYVRDLPCVKGCYEILPHPQLPYQGLEPSRLFSFTSWSSLLVSEFIIYTTQVNSAFRTL